jgi:uncharacterized protein
MSITISNNQEDKNIAILMHIGGVFFNCIPALIVYLLFSENKPWLKQESKEAFNFELSFLIYYFCAGVLIIVLIGFLILPILWLFNVVCAILAILSINNNTKYNFPLTIKFLK